MSGLNLVFKSGSIPSFCIRQDSKDVWKKGSAIANSCK